MKVFVSTLLLCFVFVSFHSTSSEARGRHKHRAVHAQSRVHVVKHPRKFVKHKLVRVRKHVSVVVEKDLCLFFCRAHQLSSDVASYGAPSPWKRMERKDAVTYRGNVDVGVGPRPYAWCGWWMQVSTGITSEAVHRNLNMAIEWARVGQPTSPHVGAIVVWRHHVGKITGVASNGRFLVMSGNSGGRRGHRTVTEHARSLRGAIAFRSL